MLPSTLRFAEMISVALGVTVLAGCGGVTRIAGPAASGAAASAAATARDQAPVVSVSPSDKTQGVPLDAVVSVTAPAGRLDTVIVQPVGAAKPVSGALSSDGRTWSSTDTLDPNVDYAVDATAMSPRGDATTSRTSFHTVSAARLTSEAIPADGSIVGVGMPIKIRFNTPIAAAAQARVLSHITVESTPAVRGAWHWFTPSEVHWRPMDYWPTGTKVTVTANLRGVEAGSGVWGFGNWSESFTIGDKHVSIIDAAAHQMQVFNNDKLTDTWPVSTGRASLPTISGTLVVWYRQQDVLMDSASIGIPRNSPDGYYEHVYWDTAISTDGFFIHAAPWSVGSQGSANVSHGCVNLSTARARTFFAFSQVGDIVLVKNTSRPAAADDGEADWQIPFDQYANTGGEVAVAGGGSQKAGGL